MKKVVLITGTSSGLGQETALLLAQKNYQVYATMRDLNKASALREKANSDNLIVKYLDITDNESIVHCVDEIIANEGHIDILINNAGRGFPKTTEQASLAEIQQTIDLNFMSVVRTTKAVLPFMREKKSGHIINISSVGGLVGQPFNEIYCGAKFAVEGFTESLATYVQPAFNVKFSVVEPGGMQSNFFSSLEKEIVFTENDPYKELFQRYTNGIAERSKNSFQSPSEVAKVIHELIENENPPVRIRTSAWAEKFCETKTKIDPTGQVLQELIASSFI